MLNLMHMSRLINVRGANVKTKVSLKLFSKCYSNFPMWMEGVKVQQKFQHLCILPLCFGWFFFLEHLI